MKLLLVLLLVAAALISYGGHCADPKHHGIEDERDVLDEQEITDKRYLEGDLSYDGDCDIRCEQEIDGYYPGKGYARVVEIKKNQRHTDPRKYRVYCQCRVN